MQCLLYRFLILGQSASRALAAFSTARCAPNEASRLRTLAALACVSALLWAGAAPALAQQEDAVLKLSSRDLPEAPRPQFDGQSSSGQTTSTEGSAGISGTVLDRSGASVAGAHVSLTGSDGSPRQSVMSGAGGAFTFSKLLPGFCVVLVQAKGFAIFTSGTLVVTAQQTLEMPPIALEVGSTSTDVEVRPTEVIAAEQIKQEEKQRVLGIIPNFYISYTWNAAPMTTKQKYSMAAREEFDWTSFVGAGFAAGLEQANNSFAGYGQGAAGYGKRYAAAFGNGLFTNFFSHAVYPSIFHQDPRYYYQGSGTIKSRALHAASFAILVRNDKGQDVPNYSFLLAAMTAGALSNLYYPHADRGANLVFTNAAIGIAGRAAGTILREFLLKPFTTNVPGNGKP